MRFEWDGDKSHRNRIKHRISFETAILVFHDPNAVSRMESITDGEERWQTIGVAAGIVVLLVVHTLWTKDGEDVIRNISTRKATPLERRAYEEGIEDF